MLYDLESLFLLMKLFIIIKVSIEKLITLINSRLSNKLKKKSN